LPGGFSPLYQTYKALEESGRVRRGYFVEGLSGAQFAWAQTVDRLRLERRDDDQRKALLISATDPANPYGSLLPWPENSGRPRRASGTKLIIVEGHPIFFLEKGGKKMTTFPKSEEPAFLEVALDGLREVTQRMRGRTLKIEEIDGEPARQSTLAARLVQYGFKDGYQGLTLMDTPR
jgi:ATP-dependent Lhr-like helicase